MKIGLIGCGTWGQKILGYLKSFGVDVVVVEKEMERTREFHPEVELSTLSATIGRVHGWIIATPASTHYEIIEALDRHANESPIFCEKPLVTKISDASRLMERKNKAPLYVMHVWTFHPGILKLKQLYQEGLIGELTQIRSTRVNWTSPRRDVDCLDNLAPHDLSIFLYILGKMPKPVYAAGESIEGKLVSCLAILLMKNGPKCIFEISNRYGEKRRELRLHGTNGVLVFKEGEGSYIELVKGEGYILPQAVETFAYPDSSALKSELQAFCRYLHDGDAGILPSLEAGIEVVNTLDTVRKLVS